MQAAVYALYPRACTVVAGSLSLLALMEAWFITKFGWPFDGNALNLVAETNTSEAIDLLSSLPWNWLLVAAAVPLPLGFIAWRYSSAAHGRARVTARRLFLFTIMALLAMAALSQPGSTDDDFDFDVGSTDTTFRLDAKDQQIALRGAFPTGLPWVLADFIGARRDLTRAIEHRKHFSFGASASSTHSRRRIYVLVVGETTRGDHLALNAYNRDTTPRLAARGDQVISLKRMYTVSTFTRLSVPVLLSRKPPESTAATFDEASIITAFKEAGFATTWISLQAPIGYHESPVSLHAAEADRQVFLNPADYRNSGKHDDAAVPALRQALEGNPDRDQFIVIHLLGSHFQYVDRYPEHFAHFLPDRPDDRKARLFNEQDKEYLINSYDNTVLFQDMVLDEIIGTLSGRTDADSWMFYTADHGEALFDDCRRHSGHGMASLATQHVASVFWASPSYAQSRSGEVAALRSHAESLTSTSMLFETLADLGELSVPRNRPNNSLARTELRYPDEVRDVEERERHVCSGRPGNSRVDQQGSR